MAQFLTLLSILLLVAVFKPDKLESSALSVPDEDEDGVVYFPIEITDPSEGSNINNCLENDDSSSYCTKLRNYPDKNHIDQLINEKFPQYKSLFNNDLALPQNISHRMEDSTPEYLCNTRIRTIFPQAGKGELQWDLVVNTEEFKQGIVIEECVEYGEICGERKGINIPSSYTAICKQQYVYQSLFMFVNESIEVGLFKFPSCCVCELSTD